jgi:sugar O-acyltransferase (sialic acid O-acetyltransferase NeuD family)
MLRDMGSEVLNFITDDAWLAAQSAADCVIAIGDPPARRRLAEYYARSPHRFPSLVHLATVCLGTQKLGRGVFVAPGGVLMPDVVIGDFTYINMGVTIGHDTRIGRWCVINHNAAISGRVTVGDEVLIGAGAVIRENLTIGDGATVGMGAVVVKDVPPGETWVGVPAHRLEK